MTRFEKSILYCSAGLTLMNGLSISDGERLWGVEIVAAVSLAVAVVQLGFWSLLYNANESD